MIEVTNKHGEWRELMLNEDDDTETIYASSTKPPNRPTEKHAGMATISSIPNCSHTESGLFPDRRGLAEARIAASRAPASTSRDQSSCSNAFHLVSREERLDTSSVAGELVFHALGAIAPFERRVISERTRDEIAAARKRGRSPGRPPLDPETVSATQKLIENGLVSRSSS